MAEIYLKQGHLLEAYEILRTLAEEDPSDRDVAEKLRTLKLKMGLDPQPARPSPLPKEDRVRFLKEWLSNIQSRRRK